MIEHNSIEYDRIEQNRIGCSVLHYIIGCLAV